MKPNDQLLMRRKTREIKLGSVGVGGSNPISVQSMTKTRTSDVEGTLEQIHALERAGCEIIRVAVPDDESAKALKEIKAHTELPLIADIHFDHKLALKSIDAGADGLRINPGNIGSEAKVKEVVEAASAGKVPIRIGVNAGSLEKDLLKKYGGPTPEALVESALGHVEILEKLDYHDIKISVKASDVKTNIEAYRLLASRCDYPLHLGLTEAGTKFAGTIKSSIGIGVLLAEGIGDTIRVSLTGDPVEEVRVGYEILKSLELRERGIVLISCPTCGRKDLDIEGIASELEKRTGHIKRAISVAVMGCVVNGPGEARLADVGVAGGKTGSLIFVKGEPLKKVEENQIIDALIEQIEKLAGETRGLSLLSAPGE